MRHAEYLDIYLKLMSEPTGEVELMATFMKNLV